MQLLTAFKNFANRYLLKINEHDKKIEEIQKEMLWYVAKSYLVT